MARVIPHNVEAEMSVLGVAFLAKDQVDKICESVSEEMFYDEKNAYIFNAIKSLHDEHTPIDITTVKNELDKSKKLSAVGLDYLGDVIASVATVANLDYYIDILKDFSVRRDLIDTATNIINDAYDEDNINTLQDTAEKKILLAVEIGVYLNYYILMMH